MSYPVLIIRAEIICIAIDLFFIGYSIYCSKYHHIKTEFLYMAITVLLHTIFALITEITVNEPNCPKLINDVCHVVFFVFAQLFCLGLFRYTLALIFPRNHIKIPITIAIIINSIGLIVSFVSPIIYYDGNGTCYSGGIGPAICFGSAVLMLIVVFFLLCFNIKKIHKSITLVMIPTMVFGLVGVIIQIFVPEFLFTAETMTFTLIASFFAIENPIERFEEKSNIDLDTHVRNRNSYELDFANLKKRIKNENIDYPLVYVICDINGLKTINDTYGHLEGDKLIRTAAEVLMDNLKSSRNIYRIGGDEFVAVYEGVELYIVESEIASIPDACEKSSKKLLAPLTISIGSALYTQGEDPNDLVRIADQRMYKNKDLFYQEKGLDRRKVQDFASVYRDGATKILKVNLTDDTFNVFKIDLAEKKKEEGYSESFSEWLVGFVKANYIHKDSLELYGEKVNIPTWKEYFDNGGEKINFIYKRRYNREYFYTHVEVVRAQEYRLDNQVVFLFVKNLGEK